MLEKTYPKCGEVAKKHISYYSFGQLVPNRHGSSDSYRYGFQGQEKDDELKGEGNSYDFGARMLDTRIGRWFAIDPEIKAFESPYVSFGNNAILNIDPDGKDWFVNNSGYYLWVEEEDDVENIPRGFRAVGSVGPNLPMNTNPYSILTSINGKLYHENTNNYNPFDRIGSLFSGEEFVGKKEYNQQEQDLLSEFESMAYAEGAGKLIGIGLKGLNPVYKAALGKIESIVVKGKIGTAIAESWKLGSVVRGNALESILSKTRYATFKWMESIKPNFPTIDFFKNGLGVQLKTFDAKKISFDFYKKAIDKLVKNIGKEVDGQIMTKAKLEIGVKTSKQLKLFEKVKKYGKSQGVQVEVFKVTPKS